MAPVATTTTADIAPATIKSQAQAQAQVTTDPGKSRLEGPMKYNGLLDIYKHHEVTPAIGREFAADLQLSALLSGPNADELVRDLAVLVSRRGVVFFRSQDISPDDMMILARRIGELSGRPDQSNMCIHPVSEYTPELVHTPKTQMISAERQNKGGGIRRIHDDLSRWASVAWHSDVSFENVPSDYSMLKVNILPEAGGDTLWVDSYGILDRMSPSFVKYLETLTAEHNAEFFHKEAENLGLKVRDDIERGNPLNKGSSLIAHHPIIRTNPVTGWKALFVNRGFTHRIDDVTKDESDMILNYLNQICIHNMDLQCRFRWEKGSVALWDNRCTWHSATFDYSEERRGDRASSLGEKPYLDPTSKFKSDGLREEGNKW
ncbi:hypothetical protein CspeluHIS016_0113770 [Cutaneotrichosporon spelunceum]|uniref:TauD/TfdA-like domain-containing protein n=1 Tax=Cutaneotrichosporon spelunceum TaxID=1672016 RepID=A0AAD3TPU0_9TREE|nr:hypothetical protein CspeluHIS016_0113770 [Cutaneotrichosporon spelunceum]